jgi:hypothetical protein
MLITVIPRIASTSFGQPKQIHSTKLNAHLLNPIGYGIAKFGTRALPQFLKMKRDQSPTRVSKKRGIYAIIQGPGYTDDIEVVTIESKSITEEEYDIILSWQNSDNIWADYLCYIDSNDVIVPCPVCPRQKRDITFDHMPKTRSEYKQQKRLWLRFFCDASKPAELNEPSTIVRINALFC